MLKEILDYLPESISNKIKNIENKNQIDEIRLRINQNIVIKIGQDLIVLDYKITKDIIYEVFENICDKSIYSYTKQISEGFITLKGGNRVGLSGSVVMDGNKVININYISSLNFRVAKQIKDCSIFLLKHIIDIENNSIFNTIIASPPGARKNNNNTRFNKKTFKPVWQKSGLNQKHVV